MIPGVYTYEDTPDNDYTSYKEEVESRSHWLRERYVGQRDTREIRTRLYYDMEKANKLIEVRWGVPNAISAFIGYQSQIRIYVDVR